MCVYLATDPVAFFTKNTSIHWHGILIALALAIGLAVAVSAAVHRKLRQREVCAVAIAAILFGFVLARVFYICFYIEVFRNDPLQIFRLSQGGYSLLGAMLGAACSIFICSKKYRFKLYDMLDVFSLGGAVAIAIGRLSGLFSHEDIGVTIQSEKWQHFPIAIYIPKTNSWSLAVLVFESMAALLIFCALLLLFVRNERHLLKRKMLSGDITLLFMLLFGISQTQLESMRVDALYMNTLGFVKIMEVCAITAAAVSLVIFSLRSVRFWGGIRLWHIAAWLLIVQGLSIGMYVEFRISAETMVSFYTMMAVSLLGVMLSGLVLYFYTGSRSAGQATNRAELMRQR